MFVSRRLVSHFYKFSLKCVQSSYCKFSGFHGDLTVHQLQYPVFTGCISRSISGNRISEKSDFQEEVKEFNDAFKVTKHEILDMLPKKASREHFDEFMTYNTEKSRQFRPLAMLQLYRILNPGYMNSNVQKMEAFVLAWIIELFSQLSIVIDDVVDKGINRRGKICWYKKSDLNATLMIPDAMLIQTILIALLHKYFSGRPSYDKLMENFFHNSSECYYSFFADEIGKNAVKDETILRELTFDDIGQLKTANSIRLPVFSALCLAGYKKIPHEDVLEKICVTTGELLQANNDFQDTYQHGLHSAEIQFEDVRNGTLSWPLYAAFKHSNKEQKLIITKHYGQSDEESVQKIKALYEELNLSQKFETYIHETKNKISSYIDLIPEEFLRGYFRNLADEMEYYYEKPKLFVN